MDGDSVGDTEKIPNDNVAGLDTEFEGVEEGDSGQTENEDIEQCSICEWVVSMALTRELPVILIVWHQRNVLLPVEWMIKGG